MSVVTALIALVLLTGLAVGAVGAAIGDRKGMKVAGFFLGFVFGPIGLVVIALLQPSPDESARVARLRGMLECPHCREFIRAGATVCRFCGRDTVPVEPVVDEDALDREWERLNRS